MKTKSKSSIRAIYHSLNLTTCVGLGLLVSVSVQAQNLFVTSYNDGNIYEVTPDGGKSIFASGLKTGSFPTPAMPLAFNNSGDLFVADASIIYEYTPTGLRSTFAEPKPNEPGPAPIGGLAFNSAGDLFATSVPDERVYQFTPGGVASIFATGVPEPGALAFDNRGNLLVRAPNEVAEFASYGVKGTVISGLISGFDGLAINTAGDLFVANEGGGVGNIIEITPAGMESIFATGLGRPQGLAFDNRGDLFVADSGSGNIYEYSPTGARRTFATGLNSPEWLAFQPVPEPSVLGLLVVGAAILLVRRRRLLFA